MNKPCYITAASLISAQPTFGADRFPESLLRSGDNRLQCLDAPYADYIGPVAIRRMSRMLKIAISCGMHCVQSSGIDTPDAIITGTGRGNLSDTERFLNDMLRLDEGTLNPTPFIQSTNNAPNGWLAMQTKAQGYNQTFVNRGTSLELALLDAMMLIEESDRYRNVLAGAYDELTDEYFRMKEKARYWKKSNIDSASLLEHDTPGTIGGEGASFFMISPQPAPGAVRLNGIRMLQSPTADETAQTAQALLHAAGLDTSVHGLLLSGDNGDGLTRAWHDGLYAAFPQLPVAAFKPWSGEYDTASGFGIWTALDILRNQQVPSSLLYRGNPAGALRYVLLINRYIHSSVSIVLLTID